MKNNLIAALVFVVFIGILFIPSGEEEQVAAPAEATAVTSQSQQSPAPVANPEPTTSDEFVQQDFKFGEPMMDPSAGYGEGPSNDVIEAAAPQAPSAPVQYSQSPSNTGSSTPPSDTAKEIVHNAGKTRR